LIGRGDRTSNFQPEGSGNPAIRDGYNQAWDLGAGQSQTANRTFLTPNNGNWPNVIKYNLISTNQSSKDPMRSFRSTISGRNRAPVTQR